MLGSRWKSGRGLVIRGNAAIGLRHGGPRQALRGDRARKALVQQRRTQQYVDRDDRYRGQDDHPHGHHEPHVARHWLRPVKEFGL